MVALEYAAALLWMKYIVGVNVANIGCCDTCTSLYSRARSSR